MRLESLQDILAQFPDHDGFGFPGRWPETEIAIQNKISPLSETFYDLKSLELMTQLARVQALQGQFAEADKTLKRVEHDIPQHDAFARQQVEIRFLLEQGRVLALQMIPSKALVFIRQAFDRAIEVKNSYFAIDAAVMMTFINSVKKQNETLQWALNEAQSTTDPDSKLWLPFLYVMNAWSLFDTRQPERALEYFEKALAATKSPQQSLAIQWSIARTKRALGQFDDALDILNGLRLEFEAVGENNPHVYLELAENMRQQQKEQDAKPYFEMAYAILSKNNWYLDNRETELARMKELSKKRY